MLRNVLRKIYFLIFLSIYLIPSIGKAEQLSEMQLFYKSTVTIRVIYQKSEWQGLLSDLQAELDREEPKDTFIPVPPALHIELIILDPQTYSEKTKAPNWVNPFFYKGKIYMRISESNISAASIAKSLKHEIIHAIINYWAGEAAPFWFDEGLAKWQEGELTNLDILNFRELYRRQGYISLEKLDLSFATMPKDMALAAYVQGSLAIDYLHITFGNNILENLLSSLKHHSNFEKALLSLTGLSYQALNERLKKHIKLWLQRNRNLY